MSNKSKVIGFDADKWGRDLTNYWVGQQTARLIAYAKDKIQQIGDKIKTYHSRNHMDRTGNLLDSLYWGVSYNGTLVQMGYYREQRATEPSYLHEFLGDDYNTLFPVNGRLFAKRHLERYMGGKQFNGWKVWFAILAPYWGYWENGFKMKRTLASNEEVDVETFSFRRFAVMAEFYDVIKSDLKPAKVRFRHPVAKYTQMGLDRRLRRDDEGRIKDYYKHGNVNVKPRKKK